jgi:hypothetical protein
MIGGIANLVALGNMSSMKLALNTAKPIISIKRLGGVVERRRTKVKEVIQRHQLITLLSSVSGNDLQQLMRIPPIPLHFHKNLSHRGWRWKISFLRIIPTSMRTTSAGTGSLRHPEG